jgi:hypothetical protein
VYGRGGGVLMRRDGTMFRPPDIHRLFLAGNREAFAWHKGRPQDQHQYVVIATEQCFEPMLHGSHCYKISG